ncbi:MAG: acyloxyacyl hydrolase [Flavobacteriales bacterium]
MKTFLLLFFLIVCTDFASFSQAQFANQSLKADVHYGFMMPHRQRIGYLNQQNVSGVELTWIHQVKGNKPWHGLFNYPQKGISFYYFNLSSKKHFGYGLGLLPHINFPIGSKRRFGIKVGYGLGYVQKPYDVKQNFKNLVIGTKINVLFNTGVNYNWNITEKIKFNCGLDLIHFSNGAFKLPNLGINNLTAKLGFAFKIGEEIISKSPDFKSDKGSWEHFLFSSFAVKEIKLKSGKKYGIYNLSSDGLKRISDKLVLGGGLDISYNSSLVPALADVDNNYIENKSDNLRMGVHGSFGLKIGRNYFLFQTGVYVRNKNNALGSVYQRLVSRFALTDKLFASFSLKSHFAVADYFEAGIGYKF